MQTLLVNPIRHRLLLFVLATLLAGCGAPLGTHTAAERPVPLAAGRELLRSELFFGRARPDGGLVSEAQWAAFVDEHVTPRFPDGLTVLDATGQYRARSGELVHEPSKVIILLHAAGAPSRARIEEIREAYRRRFAQESVLLLSSSVRASF